MKHDADTALTLQPRFYGLQIDERCKVAGIRIDGRQVVDFVCLQTVAGEEEHRSVSCSRGMDEALHQLRRLDAIEVDAEQHHEVERLEHLGDGRGVVARVPQRVQGPRRLVR